jgi:hypothetical protein
MQPLHCLSSPDFPSPNPSSPTTPFAPPHLRVRLHSQHSTLSPPPDKPHFSHLPHKTYRHPPQKPSERFYEPRAHPETGVPIHEPRYLNAIWPQVSQIHDLHFGPIHGTFFTRTNPLNLEARFGPDPQKKKKPHV